MSVRVSDIKELGRRPNRAPAQISKLQSSTYDEEHGARILAFALCKKGRLAKRPLVVHAHIGSDRPIDEVVAQPEAELHRRPEAAEPDFFIVRKWQVQLEGRREDDPVRDQPLVLDLEPKRRVIGDEEVDIGLDELWCQAMQSDDAEYPIRTRRRVETNTRDRIPKVRDRHLDPGLVLERLEGIFTEGILALAAPDETRFIGPYEDVEVPLLEKPTLLPLLIRK